MLHVMEFFGLYYPESFIFMNREGSGRIGSRLMANCDWDRASRNPCSLHAVFSSGEKKVLPDQHRPF
jgi:hypothetical protein